MSDLRALAQRRLLAQRAAGAAACAALGGGSLVLLAAAEGLDPVAPGLLGAGLAGAWALLLRPWNADPAAEVAVESDPDGVLRAALAVAPDHPFAARLGAAAAGRRLRFRSLEDLRPLDLGLAACAMLALWRGAEPAFVPGVAGAPEEAQSGAAPGAAAPSAAAAAEDLAAEESPAEAGPGEGAAAQWWAAPTPPAAAGARTTAGRAAGDPRGAVDRYLRLRNEEGS